MLSVAKLHKVAQSIAHLPFAALARVLPALPYARCAQCGAIYPGTLHGAFRRANACMNADFGLLEAEADATFAERLLRATIRSDNALEVCSLPSEADSNSEPDDYPYIQAYAELWGASARTVHTLKQHARTGSAPADAVYYGVSGWYTLTSMPNPTLRQILKDRVVAKTNVEQERGS